MASSVVRIVLWACSLKRDKFSSFTSTVRVSRVRRLSKVGLGLGLAFGLGLV